MIFIDRRLLFPVVAATACVQQASPAISKAEAALRARANEFFRLQTEKKYRQAEPMVANDTKDTYYADYKFTFKSFTIKSVEMLEKGTRAKVTIDAKAQLNIPMSSAVDADVSLTTLWRIENGKWVWYLDLNAPIRTPFGEIKPQQARSGVADTPPAQPSRPSVASLQNMVKVDRNSVVLTADEPRQTVTISNDMGGGVDLTLNGESWPGFSVSIDSKHLDAGQKASLVITGRGGDTEPLGMVSVSVSPLGTQLDIRVTGK